MRVRLRRFGGILTLTGPNMPPEEKSWYQKEDEFWNRLHERDASRRGSIWWILAVIVLGLMALGGLRGPFT
ncbi:MAG TPA: hypothetical protein VLE22_14090 [Bryobacteraceae bacterium]|nr:hypothetical protein [Bryobacteraceae bacterium]